MYKTLFSFIIILSSLSSSAQWTHKYFVDEFGDKTEDSYIVSTCTGTFSNSATSNSKLSVNCMVEIEDSVPRIRFNLFEYGNRMVKDFGGQNIVVKIKLSDGTIESFKLYGNGQYATLGVDNSIKLIEILKRESKPLKVYIERYDDYSESKYNFTLSPIGFTNAVNKLYRIDKAKNG